MTLPKNNSDNVLSSLNLILNKYDSLHESFINMPNKKIIKSKRTILINVKLLIEDTFSDIVLLKNILTENNSQFTNTINNIYKRVFKGIMLPYNSEVEKINTSLKPSSFALKTSFAPYINLLSIALKNISKFDCQLISEIEFSLNTIIKNNSAFENLKNKLQSQNFVDKLTQLFSSKDDFRFKISLIDIKENVESKDTVSDFDIKEEVVSDNSNEDTSTTEIETDNDNTNIDSDLTDPSINKTVDKHIEKVENLLFDLLEKEIIEANLFEKHFDVIFEMKKNDLIDYEVLNQIEKELETYSSK